MSTTQLVIHEKPSAEVSPKKTYKKLNIDELAKLEVKKSNPLTYGIMLLFVDRPLIYNCLKAYAYFRWLDDMVDDVLSSPSETEEFLSRQKMLINQFYDKNNPEIRSSKEIMLKTLLTRGTHK